MRCLGVAPFLVAAALGVAAPASASAEPTVTLGSTSDAAPTVILTAVACNSTVLCVALGYDAANAWYVVAIHSGIAGTPQLLTGAREMTDIACSNAHKCVAVGDHVVAIVDGVARAPQTAVSTSGGVACPTAIQCYAVGGAQVVSIVNGRVVATSTTTHFHNLIDISCLNASTCMVIGDNPFPPGPNIHNDAYALMTNGTIGDAGVIHANQDVTFESINCMPRNCFLSGSLDGQMGEALRLSDDAGTVRQTRELDAVDFNSPEIDSSACPTTSNCVYSAFDSIILTTRNGPFTFDGGVNLPDGADVSALACPSAATCVAVGEHPDASRPNFYVGFVQSFSID